MRFHCGLSFNWKTIKKWLIPILIGVLLLFSQKLNCYAGTYENNAYMRYTLTDYNNSTVWSGGIPFYHEWQTNYQQMSKFRLYLHYTNYTTYNTYYYDVTLKINYDPQSPPRVTLGNLVTSCNAFVEGSYTWTNDGCRIVSSDSTSLTIAINNLHSQDSGLITFVLYTKDLTNVSNTFTNFVQVSSYRLTIEAKEDTSISSSQFENGVNSIIDNQNDNTQSIIDNNNQNTQDIIDSITDSSIASGTSGSAYFGDNVWQKNYGLSSLLTIPIDLINSITTKTCSPLVLDLPFLTNKSITLPCISSLIQSNFQTLFDLYQLIMGGFICYNCCLHIYRDIENALDPESSMSISGYFL